MAISKPRFAIRLISVSEYVRESLATSCPFSSLVERSPKYSPPVSSRIIIISKPSPIMSSLRGQASFNSSYKYAGLRFAKRLRLFLSLSNPASGRLSAGSLYQGLVDVLPPIEPISTASEAFAASIASSVRGSPVASIEQPPIRISL